MTETKHFPVMVAEVVDALQAANGGRFVDCTLGGAGHSEAILEANEKNTLIAIDRDQRALARAQQRLSKFGSRVVFHHSGFGSVGEIVAEGSIDGMLVDLGLSTDQLKEERGFSFKDQTRLDMRMDETQELSAYHVVNEYSEKEILRVFRRGGVGKEAQAVARAIVAHRPIETSAQLSGIVNRAAAKLTSKTRINPSTVIFQAIRIEVNKEFEEIEKMLDAAPRSVRQGGRLAVITFHSLEDKLVTHRMREWQGDTAPPSWRGGRIPSKGKLLSGKPIVPSDAEIERNPPSRSARLRVFEFSSVE